jgi:glutaryl-CoA dehydrogenase
MMLKKPIKLPKRITSVMNISARRYSKALASFEWQDPLQWKSSLTSEELMLHKTAKDFSHDYLLPKIVQATRSEHFDRDIMLEFGRMGYLGCTLQGYGFPGIGHVGYGLICNALESVDSSYRSALSVQSSLVMGAIAYFGSERQKTKYLPELAAGRLIGCFGLTESNAGSDPSSMETRAIKNKDGNYVLNGSKTWITNAPIADVMVVWAKDQDGVLRGFVIDRDLRGVSTSTIPGKMSLKASSTGSIYLEDMEVSSDRLLPGCRSLAAPFSCLNNARFGISWGSLGAAQSCYEIARDYTSHRKQFQSALACKQLVQKNLADMANELSLGYLSALHVGRMMEAGEYSHVMISMVKRNNCKKAIDIARSARDMLGANGVSDEYHVMRHAINLEAVNTYEGTGDIHALIIGQAITGIAAF